MTTDQSTTKRKLELELAQNLVADLGIIYLKNWTEKELKSYRTTPVVIPLGTHGFLVGRYKLTGIHQHCWKVEQIDGRIVHNFVSKINAILYCVNTMKGKYSMAQSILDLDCKIGNLELDIIGYEHTLKSVGKKDAFKYTIALNRCIDAKLKKRALLEILKKTLNSAKYMNFGK
ncbi:hypothetical protein UFOVP257_142 [uncultured Caudovirales phage]|uniref:Uncharacterized protein n=1 Tax=uncultured Caudovirales phage TaxID=2100421 RepID=A0A6J5LJT8_9CAUD|nr:hypothetical protein UFOVP257_142 [uncultured Caudovirales phage]